MGKTKRRQTRGMRGKRGGWPWDSNNGSMGENGQNMFGNLSTSLNNRASQFKDQARNFASQIPQTGRDIYGNVSSSLNNGYNQMRTKMNGYPQPSMNTSMFGYGGRKRTRKGGRRKRGGSRRRR